MELPKIIAENPRYVRVQPGCPATRNGFTRPRLATQQYRHRVREALGPAKDK